MSNLQLYNAIREDSQIASFGRKGGGGGGSVGRFKKSVKNRFLTKQIFEI